MKLLDFIKLFSTVGLIRIYLNNEDNPRYEGYMYEVPWYLTELNIDTNSHISLTTVYDEKIDVGRECLVVKVKNNDSK